MKRRKSNPAKFERCVKSVKRSLKKTRRSGNAYAICAATRTNPTKWNPLLPLDPTSFLMTPSVLNEIEKQREKIARGMHRKNAKKRRRNGIKPTIYQALAAKLGRTPTNAELKAEVGRILREGTQEMAAKGKLPHQRKRNSTKRRTNRGRTNSVPASQDFFESFHGEPSKELIKVKTDLFYHSATGAIGDLRKLKVKSKNGKWKVTIKFAKPYPILSASENRKQLFIDGGDQSVNLKDFGINTEHESEVLGDITDVYYFTTKKHLRPEDGGTAVYHHKFGKIKPSLIYDVPNQLMAVSGGGYTIPDEGIDQ